MKNPLYGLITCLRCGSNIMPDSSSREGKKTESKLRGETIIKVRRYRCKGLCKSLNVKTSIEAILLENKIRDIIIDNLHNFYVAENLTITEEEKQKKIIDLLSIKRTYIKNALLDGICPMPVPIKGAIHSRNLTTDSIHHTNKEIDEVKNGVRHILLGDYKPIEEQEADYHKKQKKILLSKNYSKINELYKKLIKIELDIEEKNGLIYFLAFKWKNEHRYLDGKPFYKFTITNKKSV